MQQAARSDTYAAANGAEAPALSQRTFWALTLGAIGVVYGDIGTSPLYAFREAVLAAERRWHAPPIEEAILGILSLIVWALILVVSVKYVIILLRADNNGEGGTLALMALARNAVRGRGVLWIITLGMISAALFYGDAMITPALSVLSAVEGLEIAAPALEPYVVPLAVVILFGLFAVQSHGTARVAAFFGPITLVWFLTLPRQASGTSPRTPTYCTRSIPFMA